MLLPHSCMRGTPLATARAGLCTSSPRGVKPGIHQPQQPKHAGREVSVHRLLCIRSCSNWERRRDAGWGRQDKEQRRDGRKPEGSQAAGLPEPGMELPQGALSMLRLKAQELMPLGDNLPQCYSCLPVASLPTRTNACLSGRIGAHPWCSSFPAQLPL